MLCNFHRYLAPFIQLKMHSSPFAFGACSMYVLLHLIFRATSIPRAALSSRNNNRMCIRNESSLSTIKLNKPLSLKHALVTITSFHELNSGEATRLPLRTHSVWCLVWSSTIHSWPANFYLCSCHIVKLVLSLISVYV